MREGHIKEVILNDWIIDLKLAANRDEFYILTGHNALITVELEGLKIKCTAKCPENSILYSGSIYIKPESVMVASGTVLGGIVIWECDRRQNTNDPNQISNVTVPIIWRLEGHEGSIFGVSFSPDASELLTCSDDRSIRLWSLEAGNEIAVGWGHLARIWGLYFHDKDSFVSVSEDCSARVWRRMLDERSKKPILKCQQILEGHSGRNAWCGAIESGNSVLATGGGDGRIRLWDLAAKDVVDSERTVLTVDQAVEQLGASSIAGEAFKNYALVGQGNKLLITTSSGRLFCLENNKFRLVKTLGLLDGYSIIRSWKDTETVAIGGRDGIIRVVTVGANEDDDTITTLNSANNSKLSDIFALTHNDNRWLLALSPDNDRISLHKLFVTFRSTETAQILQCEPSFITTSAAISPHTGLLYLGSRHGALAIYDLKENTCSGMWNNIISQDTLTSISFRIDQAAGSSNEDLVYLTSRGGHFSIVSVDTEKPALEKCLTTRLQKGSIEGCSLSQHGDILLYGFRNDLFFIWNESKQYEVLVEKCGGPHRNWFLSIADSDIYLYYTKASNIVSAKYSNPVFSTSLLQPGTHGREIRAVEFSPIWPTVFASASEDTCIKFSRIHLEEGASASLETHCTLRKHVSGTQSVHWTPNGKFLFTSGAREELFAWKVSNLPEIGVMADPVANLPVGQDVPDLRIMDFSLTPIVDTEFYVVSTVYSDSTIKIWLFDSLKNFFSLLSSGIYRTCCLLNAQTVVSEDSYSILLFVTATDGHLAVWDLQSILASAGVVNINGTLHLEKSVKALVEVHNVSLTQYIIRARLHQSGVKAFVIIKDSAGDSLHVVSGGDDNALALTRLSGFSESTTKAEVIFSVPSAHSSTITGLCLVLDKERQGIYFVTSSVDQNLKLWQVCENEILVKYSAYTTVADTGCLAVSSTDSGPVILCGGSGLSCWSIAK